MAKKVLVVADTTEQRFRKKAELRKLWGDSHTFNAADHHNAIGVFKGLAPDIVVICPVVGSTVVQERLLQAGANVFLDGFDTLPAAL